MPNTLKLMADNMPLSTGLWRHGVVIDPNRLPISQQLAVDILAWNAEYADTHRHLDYKSASYFDEHAFGEYGKQLAERLKNELPNHMILYFDDLWFDHIRPGISHG